MNREQAEKAARELIREEWVEAIGPFAEKAVADIIERSCGQDEAHIPFSPAPCGHSSQYCYTEDGGKNIVCLVCEYKSRACGETAWVSVDERLPEEDVRVLVWNKAVKDWEIATRDRGRFIDDTGTQTDLTNVVTYWATLPSPPTGRTEENMTKTEWIAEKL